MSSNINELIKTTLNFFIRKFHNYKKAKNAYKRIKIKTAPKTYLRGKYSLIRLFTFCAFAWVSLCHLVLFILFCAFSAFSAFSVCEIFSLKNKKFKTA